MYRDEVFWYYNLRIYLKERCSYVSKSEQVFGQNVGDRRVD